MPRKRPKLRHDVNETAFRTLQAAIGEGARPKESPNPEAVARGRMKLFGVFSGYIPLTMGPLALIVGAVH
jgi:hypothetical protein